MCITHHHQFSSITVISIIRFDSRIKWLVVVVARELARLDLDLARLSSNRQNPARRHLQHPPCVRLVSACLLVGRTNPGYWRISEREFLVSLRLVRVILYVVVFFFYKK